MSTSLEVPDVLDDLAKWVTVQEPEKRSKRRVNRRALLAFLVIGAPAALVLSLSYLAYWGIYVDALRPFWRPISEDVVWLLCGVALLVTLFDLLRSR